MAHCSTRRRQFQPAAQRHQGTKAPRHDLRTRAYASLGCVGGNKLSAKQPSLAASGKASRVTDRVRAAMTADAQIAVTAVARARLRMPGDWAADRAGRASRCLTGAKAFDEIGGWSALGAISRTGGGWRMAHTYLVGSAAAPRATSPQPSPAQSSRPTRRPSPAEPLLL